MNEGAMALMMANSRAPQERVGDVEAQLAAHRVGESRLRDVMIAQGIETTIDHASALMDYSHRMTQSIITAIPDGEYSYQDALEGDGQAEFEIPIKATITVTGAAMTVDFAGSAPQVMGNVNAVPAIVRSATWYCVRLLADDDVPVNDGCFRPVTVHVPSASVVNPRFPAAVSVGNTETGQRVVDTVLGALAQALPDVIPAASQGTMNNVTVGGTVDETQFVYYETIGGGHGASPQGDGLSGRQSHMTNTMNTPVEALERVYPMRVLRYSLRENSGGGGRHRGGDGIVREYEFLSRATITLNSERRTRAPYGVRGGDDGATGANTVIQAGEAQRVSSKYTTTVHAGDRVRIATPGGGGWGAPEDSV